MAKFKALRHFTANGQSLKPGDVVELEHTERVQALIEQRKLLLVVDPPKGKEKKPDATA